LEPFLAALGGTALGGLLAYFAEKRAFRRARAFSEAEAVHQELAVLEGLIFEIGVSERMAERKSPTPLPTHFLLQAVPLSRYMESKDLSAVLNYWQAVLRYNGRVARIIAYGSAKRMRGESPGSEKPTTHAEVVRETGPAALEAVRKLKTQRRGRVEEIEACSPDQRNRTRLVGLRQLRDANSPRKARSRV
jgi:hypothetical protein